MLDVEDVLDDYQLADGYKLVFSGENEMINDAIGQVGLMLVLALVFMYLIMVAQFQSLLSPFIIMFFGSLRGYTDTMLYPKELFYPHSGYTLENYEMLLFGKLPEGIGQVNTVQDYKIGRWFLNSCFSAIGGTVLYLFVASLAAYAFTFINFKNVDFSSNVAKPNNVIASSRTAI